MKAENLFAVRRGIRLAALAIVGLICEGGATAHTDAGGKTGNANQEGLKVPPGIVLPVRLNHGLSSKSARAGQEVMGRIMQDVPLPDGDKISQGTKIVGAVVSATPAGDGSGGRVSFRFAQLQRDHHRTEVTTNLRALASLVEVQSAEIPEDPGLGTPGNWVPTRQVGGDEVYGVSGLVTDASNHTVGHAVSGGVLVHVRARPGTKCRGALDAEDRLQALWVFSSDACGVYGLTGVTLEHAGRTEPVGEIVLAAEKGDVKVRTGSGLLLRVVR
jgi:hypothetical protein